MGKAKRQARKEVRKQKQEAKKTVKVNKAKAKAERKISKSSAKQTRKANVAAKRQEAKETRKTARIEKRTNASTARTQKRANMAQKRIDKREMAGTNRINKRLEKKLSKRYDGIEPELKPEVAEADLYKDELIPLLEEQGIPIEDESDPIEIMSKYVQTNPDMADPIPDEIYEDAFVNEDDHYAGTEEEFEKFNFQKTALRGVKGAFKGVFDEFDKYTGELKDKQNSGVPLTEQERKILNAKNKVDAQIKTTVVEKVTDSAKSIALPAVVILILIIIFK